MSVYLVLYHGRHTPDEELEDWGFDGPVLGPFPRIHLTYLCTVDVGDGPSDNITLEGDMFKFMEGYYGDVIILSADDVDADIAIKARLERTQALLKDKPDAVQLVGHPDEWVKHYARTKLTNGGNAA